MKNIPDVCEGKEYSASCIIRPSIEENEVSYVRPCTAARREKEFSKGELIFGPYDTEDRVFEIKEGEVEIFQLSPSGKKVIIDLLIPGNIFSNSSFSDSQNVESHDFALARSRVVLCVLQKSDFMKALKTTPGLAVSMIREISERLSEADDRIRDLALSSVKDRLISELVRLGRRFGIELNNQIVLEIKLSHEELAEMIGTTRETVTRVLLKLRQDKVISLDESRHLVLDKQRINQAYTGS